MKTLSDFSIQEIEEMLREKGLKLTCVVKVNDVKQKGLNGSYLTIKSSEEQFERDKNIFNLRVLEENYMLLTCDEIKQIDKDGYLWDG